MRYILTLMVAAALLAGCASSGNPGIGDGDVSETERAALRAALRIGTTRAIENHAGFDPATVLRITSDIRDHANLDGEVDLEAVRELLQEAQSRYGLTMTEVAALNELVTVAKSRLDESRATDVTARLGEYLQWIESAAELAQ